MKDARNNKRVWIARNSDGTLDLFSDKPIRKKYAFESDVDKWLCYLDDAFYPEITWENSPKELTIKRNRTNDKQRKASSKRQNRREDKSATKRSKSDAGTAKRKGRVTKNARI